MLEGPPAVAGEQETVQKSQIAGGGVFLQVTCVSNAAGGVEPGRAGGVLEENETKGSPEGAVRQG